MSRQVAARLFSGIQPTGSIHLGNYLGAVKRWVDDVAASDPGAAREDRLFSVVDLHAITLPQDPATLRSNIRGMTASLLACGLDTARCVLFQQSAVKEHSELAWVLGCSCTLPMLGQLSQYKEKSAKLKETPLGLFVYPVLQSADILLYKGTHVPVGEDNLQNIQVARELAGRFNRRVGQKVFPKPRAVLMDGADTNRVKSLRDPSKKMSKSDPDWRSCIYVADEPDIVVEKCRKALTDFDSRITYDPEARPGVSNLISLYGALTGQTPEEVCAEAEHLNTVEFKLRVAEVINETLRPIRDRLQRLEADPGHLERTLEEGAGCAREIAERTMTQVKSAVGFE